jgi:hypothetical protein
MSTATTWVGNPALLLDWTSRLSVAHHIPGRIRLKLRTDGIDLSGLGDGVRAFTAALGACPAIGQVQVNLLARSCTITYDTRDLAPSTWSDLINGQDTAPVRDLIEAIAAAARANGNRADAG